MQDEKVSVIVVKVKDFLNRKVNQENVDYYYIFIKANIKL